MDSGQAHPTHSTAMAGQPTIRRLGMRNRVELQEEPDHIGVWPDQSADQEQG